MGWDLGSHNVTTPLRVELGNLRCQLGVLLRKLPHLPLQHVTVLDEVVLFLHHTAASKADGWHNNKLYMEQQSDNASRSQHVCPACTSWLTMFSWLMLRPAPATR
eukprot:2755875-Amphidinium_carterae.1